MKLQYQLPLNNFFDNLFGMENAGFYIFAVVAVIIAALVLKHVVTCLMRTLVVVVLVIVLAFAYYFLVGQYDPEMHDAVENAIQNYQQQHGDSSSK